MRRGVWAGTAAVLFAALALTGCTEMVSERCRGSDSEHSCTVSYKRSDGKWSTKLDSNVTHTTATVNGTFTIDSGSGTLLIRGADGEFEYPLSPEEPVVVDGIELELQGRTGESWLYLEVVADPEIEGFSAEYDWSTR